MLHVLSRRPEGLTSGQVHRLIGRYSLEGVRKALARLSREGIVDKDQFGPVGAYALNEEHIAFDALQQLSQIRQVLVERLLGLVAGWSVQPVYLGLCTSGEGRSAPVEIVLGLDTLLGIDEAAWDEQITALEARVERWTGTTPMVHDLLSCELHSGLAIDPTMPRLRRNATVLIGSEAWLLGFDLPGARPRTTLGPTRGEHM